MNASLPHEDPAPEARRAALEAERVQWRFDPDQRGLPLAAKSASDRYTPAYVLKVVKLQSMLASTRVAAALDPRLLRVHAQIGMPNVSNGVAERSMVALEAEQHYDGLFHTLPATAYQDFSNDDGFFAWQRVAGCNSTHLRRQREADPRFPVTDDHLRAAIGDGDSLDRARAEGRVYVLDLSALAGVPMGATQGYPRYCDSPLALFVRTLDGALRPVAIQRTAAGGPIYTPADGERWRLARLGVNAADSVWAGAVMHLGICHSIAGGVQVCTARELAPQHPLRRLLWPHFEMTAAANETMKTDVIGVGGYFDELLAPTREASIDLAVQVIRSRSMRDAAPWRDLALRGCDDVDALPEYPFRDDGMPIAHALRRWVDGYLRLWYTSDADLSRDPELVAWHAALGAADGATLHDLPSLATIDELVDLVTTVIFQITAGHAAVNYNGYDQYAWAATYPSALWAPPLDPAQEPTSDDYLRALAPLGIANRMLDLTLPQRELRLNTLGEFPPGWFDDPRVEALATALRDELATIEAESVMRDAGRQWRFPYLLPSRVAQSIHV